METHNQSDLQISSEAEEMVIRIKTMDSAEFEIKGLKASDKVKNLKGQIEEVSYTIMMMVMLFKI